MNSFFYSQIEENAVNQEVINLFKQYANDNKKQVYITNKPLGEKKYKYSYEDALLVLLPLHKIIFINIGQSEIEFEEYCEDFIEDIGYVSDKYGYRNILGRPRNWREGYVAKEDLLKVRTLGVNCFLSQCRLQSKEDERNGELLISLVTGSINDVSRVGGEVPTYPLDMVKKKIILFDGDQTRFIYQEPLRK